MSHPTPDIWRPPWGEVHRRPETCSGREPYSFLVSAASPARQMASALHGTEVACAASCLADLVGEIRLSDEPPSDAGTDGPESRLVSLLDQLHVVSEPAVDLESVGSTDPMLVDSDTASLDEFLDTSPKYV